MSTSASGRPLVGFVVFLPLVKLVALPMLLVLGLLLSLPVLADHPGPLVERQTVTGSGTVFCGDPSGGNPGLGFEYEYKLDSEPAVGAVSHTLQSEPPGGPPLQFTIDWNGTHLAFESEVPVQAVIIKPGTVSGDVYAYEYPPLNPQGLWNAGDSFPGATDHDNGLTKSVSQAISHVSFCLDGTPRIRVDKVLEPNDDSGLFDLLINGTVEASAVGHGGSTGFVDALIGSNQVSEQAVAPADLDEYVVSIGGDCDEDGNVTLDWFESAVCVITNTRKGSVQLIKLTDGAISDTAWSFRLSGPEGDTYATTGSGDDAGLIDFGDRLVPGAYRLCETNLPAGWSSNWEFDGEVVLPIMVDNEPCHDFEVEVAGNHQFVIDNISPPGGTARTIGYWSNWNACTPGNQAQTAAANGGADEGYYLVEDVIPENLGALVIDTCEDSVSILRKQDLGGNNQANDGAYSLAAQLLAAKFNLSAGAAACAEALDAVSNGDSLLMNEGFNGYGDYLGPQNRPKRNIRNQALSLADALDQYNNNTLCP